jgi:L,D-transpeptidase catalytic domain
MGGQGKHRVQKPTVSRRKPKVSRRKPKASPRPAALVSASVASTALVMTAAYVGVTHFAELRAAVLSGAGATQTPGSAGEAANLAAAKGPRLILASEPAAAPPVPGSLVLTAGDHSACPPAAAACVDLSRHLTWLQSDGKVTFGPVRMEPATPGSANATPRGTFTVLWKGGPNVISNIYKEPMPWAVQFTSGGVAFHAGSLTVPSHGCVHLTMANAHYYNEHLAIGAEVVVF